ncbi:hypothetical protein B0T24DRAFT_619309 [Lasiosphaeria ovina]|uniref:Uncharacterized protein n=1 Tax=Lasiosphaeria ovina TaxID=92902 RepID=A0AAE0KH82_9PEZI|nr:hypothetical protein B0T24DRAFT_619309 [Lasiosphaeria ovina]
MALFATWGNRYMYCTVLYLHMPAPSEKAFSCHSFNMKFLAPSLLSLGSGAFAASCLLDQPRRSNEPNGTQIAAALTPDLQPGRVCSGWRINDIYQLNITYNHWDVLYYVERKDNTQLLRHCQEAFTNIIDQCVVNGNFWGGTWSLDGEYYKLSNNAYPANGLSPQGDGQRRSQPLRQALPVLQQTRSRRHLSVATPPSFPSGSSVLASAS